MNTTPTSASGGTRRRRFLLQAIVACGSPWTVSTRAATAVGPRLAEAEPSSLSRWITEAEHALRGRTSVAVMKMHIERSDFQREYDLLLMSDDRTATGKVLIRLLGPALWRGNATLKVSDRISFYDPRTRRITVMSNSMLADRWMGSHFTNDDLTRETDLALHYSYELVKREAVKDEAGREVARLTLRLRPKPEAPVAWGKVHYQLELHDDDPALPLQVDYFRRAEDARPERSLQYSQLREIEGRLLPQRLVMQAVDRPGEFTRIDYARLSFETDFGDDDFSERAMR